MQNLSGRDDVLKGPFTNETKDVRGIKDTDHSFVLGDLVLKTTYEVYVSAENSVGIGEPAISVFETLGDENGQSCKSYHFYSIIVYIPPCATAYSYSFTEGDIIVINKGEGLVFDLLI